MKKLIFNLKVSLILFLCLGIALTGGLIMQQFRSKSRLAVAAGENLISLRQRYAQAGSVTDSSGELLAWSENGIRHYHQNSNLAKAVLHTVGDYTQRIDNTIETRYQPVLLGTDRNFFHQFWLDVQGKGLGGDDVVLTLDSKISLRAAELLANRRGAVVVINYKTGEIIATTSTPSVDPQSVIDYENIPDTGLFNRALRGSYAPGSVFKLITALAWLQSDDYDPEYHVDCHGESTIDSDYANENGDGHGLVYLEDAISRSCNVFFGELGVKVGREALLNTAAGLGIGEGYNVDRLTGISSFIECEEDDLQLSWLAIGQPTGNSQLSMSPIELARFAGAIANQGVLMESHIIDHFTDPTGREYRKLKPTEERRLLNERTAANIEEMMIKAVKEGTGSGAGFDQYIIAGKTGTVQVVGQANNALFIGYIIDEDNPLAIAVIVEEGGSGGGTAAPLAGEILRYAVNSKSN